MESAWADLQLRYHSSRQLLPELKHAHGSLVNYPALSGVVSFVTHILSTPSLPTNTTFQLYEDDSTFHGLSLLSLWCHWVGHRC